MLALVDAPIVKQQAGDAHDAGLIRRIERPCGSRLLHKCLCKGILPVSGFGN